MLMGDSLNNLKIIIVRLYDTVKIVFFLNHCIKISRQFEKKSLINDCKLYTNDEELAEADKFGYLEKMDGQI